MQQKGCIWNGADGMSDISADGAVTPNGIAMAIAQHFVAIEYCTHCGLWTSTVTFTYNKKDLA